MAAAVRLTNIIVMLIGLVLVGYAVYMIIEAPISALSGAVLALGVIDASLGLLVASCGTSGLFYLRLYSFVMGLLELAQIAVAAMFISPPTQQKIIDAIKLPADIRSKIEANITVSGYVLLAVVAFQALTLVLVLLQSCSIDQGFDEDGYDAEQGLLGGSRTKNKRDFGALDDESVAVAASRYREKAGRFYQKYGIK